MKSMSLTMMISTFLLLSPSRTKAEGSGSSPTEDTSESTPENPHNTNPEEILYAWLQLGVDSTATGDLQNADHYELRVITKGDSCPEALISGSPHTMQLRAAKDDRFPVTTCVLAGEKNKGINAKVGHFEFNRVVYKL